MSMRLLYLVFLRLAGLLVLLSRSSASKDVIGAWSPPNGPTHTGRAVHLSTT
jgi:hypothetical protein